MSRVLRLLRSDNPAHHIMVFLALTMWVAPSVAADNNVRIMVYLELPGSVADTRITLAGLEIVEGSNSYSLPLSTSELISEKLAGKQVLLTSAVVPVGSYGSLRFQLKEIFSQVGVAEVSPLPPPEGISIPLDLEMQAGQTATVFLFWQPIAVDPDKEFHTPEITILEPEIPPLGSLALVSSRETGSIVVVNRLTLKVVSALAVGEDPRGLAYSRNEQELFVALAGRDAIAVIDVLSLRVINVVSLQFGDEPARLLLSPDETTLFVLCPGSRTLSALSVWSMQQQFRVVVGDRPRSMAMDPVSGRVFVACEDEGRVQIVDPASGSVTASLAQVSSPAELVIEGSSRLLYVGAANQRAIRSFQLDSEDGGGSLNICGPVGGFAVNPKKGRLYASVPTCGNIAVIRPEIGIEFGSIDLPGSPGLLAFDRDYRQLWVILPETGALAICNANLGQLVGIIEVGADPFEVVIP